MNPTYFIHAHVTNKLAKACLATVARLSKEGYLWPSRTLLPNIPLAPAATFFGICHVLGGEIRDWRYKRPGILWQPRPGQGGLLEFLL